MKNRRGTSLRHQLNWIWSTLGAVASSAALTSLFQRVGDIELAEVPAQYLQYYRSLIAALTGWIPLPFGWVIQQWYADLMGLAAILATTLVRTERLVPLGPISGYPYEPISTPNALATVLSYTAFPPLVIIGLAIGIGKATYLARHYHDRDRALIIAEALRTEEGFPTAQETGRYWQRIFILFLVVSLGTSFIFFLASGALLQLMNR